MNTSASKIILNAFTSILLWIDIVACAGWLFGAQFPALFSHEDEIAALVPGLADIAVLRSLLGAENNLAQHRRKNLAHVGHARVGSQRAQKGLGEYRMLSAARILDGFEPARSQGGAGA